MPKVTIMTAPEHNKGAVTVAKWLNAKQLEKVTEFLKATPEPNVSAIRLVGKTISFDLTK